MQDQDINHIIRILRKEVPQWKVPALAHFSDTPFRTLISCILSLRTQDRTTMDASTCLFSVADTPQRILEIRTSRLEKLIYPVSFYRVKAQTIKKIARDVIDKFGGQVPDSLAELLTLPGVGRKTANIVVTLAFKKPGIAVDIHVHRISNRLGYVSTKNPDDTEMVLRKKLPRRHWIVLNDLLVTFGQNLCKPVSPFCSKCPIGGYCERVGVERSR
jgi:endonuclease-3